MTKRAVERLSQLLKTERAALLAGDFDAVGEMIAEKEALVDQFEGVGTTDLRLLATALAQNSRLFAAAHDGVTTVMTTLAQQKAARTTLSSYDSSGKATRISQATRGTERRY